MKLAIRSTYYHVIKKYSSVEQIISFYWVQPSSTRALSMSAETSMTRIRISAVLWQSLAEREKKWEYVQEKRRTGKSKCN